MIRQVLVSLVVIVAAAVGYVFLVPGAPEQLARFGINLPIATPAAATAPAAGQAPAAKAPGSSGGNASGGGSGSAARPGAGAPGAGGPGGGGRGGNRTMVVVTAPAIMATVNDKLTAIGDGQAAHSVTVMSPASGTLTELLVKPGDRVAAGAVLGHLDSDAETIAYQRALLAQKDAAAALTRAEELAKANSATTVQLNAAQLAADNADLALQSADLDLKRRTITTPIGGTVGLFQVNPGNTVTAQTVVTTIEDDSDILVSFWVPERYATSVKQGMPVTAEAVALPGQAITGEVSAIDNRIDPTSRTLQLQARIANTDGLLRPGMSFSVSLGFAGESFPAVDPLAIQWSSDGAYLWRYVADKVEKVPVEIIQRNSDGVLVRADLKAGDMVVTQGVQQLSAGATVRLLDAPQAGKGAEAGKTPGAAPEAAPGAGTDPGAGKTPGEGKTPGGEGKRKPKAAS